MDFHQQSFFDVFPALCQMASWRLWLVPSVSAKRGPQYWGNSSLIAPMGGHQCFPKGSSGVGPGKDCFVLTFFHVEASLPWRRAVCVGWMASMTRPMPLSSFWGMIQQQLMYPRTKFTHGHARVPFEMHRPCVAQLT